MLKTNVNFILISKYLNTVTKYNPLISYAVTTWFIVFLFSLSTSKLSAQIKVTINIVTTFTNVDSTRAPLQGAFGLYQQAYFSNSSPPKDTFIKELDYTNTQDLELDFGHYKLIFTPYDTTKKSNEYYFSPYKGMLDIELTGFFFNQNHISLLSQMNILDTLHFYSSYYGVTHEEMLIPASILSIVRNYDRYYIAYNKCDYYQHQALIRTKAKTKRREKIMDLQLVLLTKKQVELLRQFEVDIYKASIKNNLLEEAQAFNQISLGDQQISFYSKWSLSNFLHKKLLQN